MKELLVVVDMQNDFIDGSLGTAEAVAILPYVLAKVKAAVENDVEVVFTMDTHSQSYLESLEGRHLPVVHCVKDTPGWQIHPALAPFAATIFTKPGFGSTELIDHIKKGGYGHVEFVGLCTDICVVTNALMLKGALPELPVSVDPKGCAGVTSQSHQSAIETMKMCQIDV